MITFLYLPAAANRSGFTGLMLQKNSAPELLK
jgi:hypothetical protein